MLTLAAILLLLGLVIFAIVFSLGRPKKVPVESTGIVGQNLSGMGSDAEEVSQPSGAERRFFIRLPQKPTSEGVVGSIPSPLKDFHLMLQGDLSEDQQDMLKRMAALVPKPPTLLQELLRDATLNSFDTTKLVQLITSDPVLAAKLLGTVNSAFYGARFPIHSVQHAVVFLGLNAVKDLALRLTMQNTFEGKSLEVKVAYTNLWEASMVSSDLTFRLAQKLKMKDEYGLATQSLLSFLGYFAVLAIMPAWANTHLKDPGLFDRTLMEQDELQINTALIGAAMGREWGLPKVIVNGIRDSLLVMVTPPALFPPKERMERALCYACCRLGEMVVFRGVKDVRFVDFSREEALEFHFLKEYLSLQEFNQFYNLLSEPDLLLEVQRINETLAGKNNDFVKAVQEKSQSRA